MYNADYPAKGDPLLPVDLHAIAARLGCDVHLLFGRLHFDMGTRLRHRDPRNPNVTLASVFEVAVGSQRNVVNFPYLTAMLALLEERRRRDLWTVWLSIAAIVVAVVSVAVQVIAWSRPAG